MSNLNLVVTAVSLQDEAGTRLNINSDKENIAFTIGNEVFSIKATDMTEYCETLSKLAANVMKNQQSKSSSTNTNNK